MPSSIITTGSKDARKYQKSLRKKGLFTRIKTLRKATPTTYGAYDVRWSKTKRPGLKKY